jgi:hypothetical protein
MKTTHAFNIILWSGLYYLPWITRPFNQYAFAVSHAADANSNLSYVEWYLSAEEVGQLMGGN